MFSLSSLRFASVCLACVTWLGFYGSAATTSSARTFGCSGCGSVTSSFCGSCSCFFSSSCFLASSSSSFGGGWGSEMGASFVSDESDFFGTVDFFLWSLEGFFLLIFLLIITLCFLEAAALLLLSSSSVWNACSVYSSVGLLLFAGVFFTAELLAGFCVLCFLFWGWPLLMWDSAKSLVSLVPFDLVATLGFFYFCGSSFFSALSSYCCLSVTSADISF